MKFTLSKSILYQLLFTLCVTVVFLNKYELTFAVWTIVALFTLSRFYSVTILKYVACFAAIFVIAFIVSFFKESKSYYFIRDITYMVKPILGLLVGYQICKKSENKTIAIVIYTGVFVSMAHLGIILFTMVSNLHLSFHQIRAASGYFSDFEIYALILLLFSDKFNFHIGKYKKMILVLIVVVSSVLYFSRTNFIQFVILYIAMKGYFRITARSIYYLLIALGMTLLTYTVIYYSNPRREAKGFEGFLYKVKISPIEPFKTKINKDDWKDFNDNYRSYENIITIKQVSNNGTSAIIFGEGLGSTIDLKRQIWTNDGELIRYIPILHNAFMTVFLKSGLLGVALSILFIYLLLKHEKTDLDSVRYINWLLVGSGVFLIVSNWVFLGLYLKLDNKSILIGFLIAYREILLKQDQQNRGEITNE
ncbi:hypothetical protein [Flavobacterium sp. '19STA2R22 D10 B1']|uniref:hypothetical protein n=1 Tax=Flavobacterium aerium TaxID=3037261 RepID=UPI00278C5547|nr:hypothetical protein [Flavobacterium sp. '19STA2R22 D10 B1']